MCGCRKADSLREGPCYNVIVERTTKSNGVVVELREKSGGIFYPRYLGSIGGHESLGELEQGFKVTRLGGPLGRFYALTKTFRRVE